MSLSKTIESMILLFISFQGVLILIDPEHRNKLYSSISAVNEGGVPLLQSMAERGRLLVALALIPTCLYPRSWIIPKFISLIAYVIYIGILYNLYLFHTFEHIGHFLFQLLVLIQVLFMIDQEQRNNNKNSRQKQQQVSSQSRQSEVLRKENLQNSQKAARQKAK